MQVDIRTIPPRKLVGIRMTMSMADNLNTVLWRSFMPRRKEIHNKVSAEVFSVERFDFTIPYHEFTPQTRFEKWGAVEVSEFTLVPDGMETTIIEGGLYAVFLYKGRSSDFASAFQYIFETWLPTSRYVIDNRAQFEIMGEKYINDDPASEEELWIPIRAKYNQANG